MACSSTMFTSRLTGLDSAISLMVSRSMLSPRFSMPANWSSPGDLVDQLADALGPAVP